MMKYENAFKAAERHYRSKAADWHEIIQELHADRGMLLGSSQYGEMTGIERMTSLMTIDKAIYDAHGSVIDLQELRDKAVSIPAGFKYRTRILRRTVLALGDKALEGEE
tara:strand:+ start:37 stop:363 length:327 start_codon:yes stop_codon:yes gene_type:complete